MYKPIWPGTYYFNTFTFTSMGNSGHRGPTSNQTYADAPWPSSDYFSIKNGQQNWTAPANGVYQITAAGAYGATPGRVVTGQATLSEGQTLTMLVGQQPTPLTANVADNVTVGGGGGTFVTTNGVPLIVASGGDGQAYSDNEWSQPVTLGFPATAGLPLFMNDAGTQFTVQFFSQSFQVLGSELYTYDGTQWNPTFLFDNNESCFYFDSTSAYTYVAVDSYNIRVSTWAYGNGTWTKTGDQTLTITTQFNRLLVSQNGQTLRIEAYSYPQEWVMYRRVANQWSYVKTFSDPYNPYFVVNGMSYDGNRMAALIYDNDSGQYYVQVFDYPWDSFSFQFPVEYFNYYVAAISSDGTKLVTFNNVYSLSDGSIVTSLPGYASVSQSFVKISKDGNTIIKGYVGGELQVINAPFTKVNATLPPSSVHAFYYVLLNQNGTFILTTSIFNLALYYKNFSARAGQFLPSGNGSGGSGAGFYGDGAPTNPYFQFLVPKSYTNGGFGNSYEYGQPELLEQGGFGGGQSPINKLNFLTNFKILSEPTTYSLGGSSETLGVNNNGTVLYFAGARYVYSGGSWNFDLYTGLTSDTGFLSVSDDGMTAVSSPLDRPYSIGLRSLIIVSNTDLYSVQGQTARVNKQGTRIAYASGSNVFVRDTPFVSEYKLPDFPTYVSNVTSLDFSADGNTLAIGTNIYDPIYTYLQQTFYVFVIRYPWTTYETVQTYDIVSLSPDGNTLFSTLTVADSFPIYKFKYIENQWVLTNTTPTGYNNILYLSVGYDQSLFAFSLYNLTPSYVFSFTSNKGDFTQIASIPGGAENITSDGQRVFTCSNGTLSVIQKQLITANTATNHGFPYNYQVNFASTANYNGVHDITVSSSNTFTFQAFSIVNETGNIGTVSGIEAGVSGGGGYTGSPGDGIQGATCYADPSVQNFTDLGATSNTSGYVTISLVNPVPLVQTPTWNKIWTTQYDPFVPAQSNAAAVTNGNGIYVAVTNNGQSPVLDSSDGASWYTTNTTGTVVAPWCAIAYGNSLFVALASDGTSMTSSDGVNWSVTYGYPFWSGIAYGNGLFVAVTNGYMPASWYSTDGTTWSYGNLSTDKWSTISYGNGVFSALTNWGTVSHAYSYDGIAWSSSAAGFNNLVSTVAGQPGVSGSSDGTGTSAQFNHPEGITSDGSGNVYIVDTVNSTIRKLVVSTGEVTTIAGTAGVFGSNDGIGPSAQFHLPSGITCDGNGNLYICDSGNNTIRKLEISTGVVTTIAGLAGFSGSSDGTGTSALFYYPTGITCDGNGNLYICDTLNFTIRKLVISTGAVTTIAGLAGSSGSSDGTGTSALFNYPTFITYDGNGNLYICDSGNNTIRKLEISTGVVTTIAGLAGSSGSSDGTGTSALFYYPQGITYDGAGNLYIVDTVNNTIRKLVISTAAVTTIAGLAGSMGSRDGAGTFARFFQPCGITSIGSGNFYISDGSVNSTIRKLQLSGTPFPPSPPYIYYSFTTAQPGVFLPYPLTTTTDGNTILISSLNYAPNTFTNGTLTRTFAPPYPNEGFGWSSAISGDGETIVVGAPNASSNVGNVYVYSSTGTLVRTLTGASANVMFGSSLALSADGSVLIAGAPGVVPGYANVYTNGVLTRTFSGGVGFGWACATNAPGTVFAISALLVGFGISGDQTVTYVQGNTTTVLSGQSPGDGFGWAIALNTDGSVLAVSAYFGAYVNVYKNGSIMYTVSGTYADQFGWSIALGPDGHALVVGAPLANSGDGVINVYRDGTLVKTLNGSSGTASGFGWTVAISRDDRYIITSSRYGSNVQTFSLEEAALTDSWTASTYGGNGLFAAVSSNGLTMYSQTGTSWIQGGSLGVSSNAITYGQGYFVAPSSNASVANVMISTDCLTWSNVAISTAAAYSGATYESPYGFVLVSPSTFEFGLTLTFFANSNQVNSTKRLNATTWSQLAYGNGVFVAGGQGLIQSTLDGATWSKTTVSNTITSVAYSRDLGTFLAFGNVFVDGTYTSRDGVTWTQNAPLGPAVPSANAHVTWGLDKYVAVLENDSNVLYSQDGSNWNVTTDGTTQGLWASLAYGNGRFVALRDRDLTVSTIAGLAGSSGSSDGTGTNARFNNPIGITCDGNGNVYIVDKGNCIIRKLVISTGVVTTIAGLAGSSGPSDGTGTSAQFNHPEGITSDGSGNVYIVDTVNSTIRKLVVSTGEVTTIAGTAGVFGSNDGIGPSAQFHLPSGITCDGNGNLYICDSGNNTIRKLVISTGVVTTIAGLAGSSGSSDGTGTSALFYYPSGITYDGNGNLYVCDTGNSTIRKLVISTGAVTTIAGLAGSSGSSDGTGTSALFNYPTFITYDGNGNLYICDSGNNTIRKLVISTGVVTTIAGLARSSGSSDGTGTNARFYFLYGITYDGNGNLYVCDTGNDTIRNVNAISQYMTSVNGINWAASSTTSIGDAPFITYGNGLFVAVGSGGAAFSENGTTWTQSVNAPQYSWTSVVYGNGYFIAVASSGSVMYSQNGTTWYTDTSGAGALPWGSIAFGNNTFLAIEQIGADSIQTQVTQTF